jgi:competence CoiA-like predicted nuclease
MPLIAHYLQTGERIDITQLTNPRAQLAADQIGCQLCSSRMIIKQGLIKRWHFAHVAACPEQYASHPETIAHLLGKEEMRRYLRLIPEFATAQIDLEVPIHDRKRIADVLATFPQGHRMAVEIQLAGITTEELAARTKDYYDDGIDVLWCLGGTAYNSPANREWCTGECGGYLILTFDEHNATQEVVLHATRTTNGPARQH